MYTIIKVDARENWNSSMFYQMKSILNNRTGRKVPVEESKQSQVIIIKAFWKYEKVSLAVVKIKCECIVTLITHFCLATNTVNACTIL